MGRSGPPSPIDARWSKSQTWSKPPSSAIRHTARKASMVVSCPESFSPKRSGCVMGDLSCLVETGWSDADRVVVLLGELLRRHADAPEVLAVLTQITRDLAGRRMLRIDLRRAVDPHHVLSRRVRVQVQRNVRVRLDVAHLLTRDRIDEKGLAVPPEPTRHCVGVAVATHCGKPDDQLPLETCHRVLAGHIFSLRLSRWWQSRCDGKDRREQEVRGRVEARPDPA